MPPAFDPSRSVSFDVEHGHVELSDGQAQILVPVAVLAAFASGAIDVRGMGRSMGSAVFDRVAARFRSASTATGTMPPPSDDRDAVRSASLETVVELLGGELALVGLGNLRVERWGQALLFVLDPCAIDARGDALLCGIIEGALASIARRDVAAGVVDRSGRSARVLVASSSVVAAAVAEVRRGAFFTEVVQSLQGGSAR